MTKLSSKQKWTRADIQWGNLNKKLKKYMANNDFFMMGTTYYQMAEFLKKEDKNPNTVKLHGYKMKLKAIQNQVKNQNYPNFVTKHEILSATDSCKHCLKLNNKIVKLSKALKGNPLPIKRCEHKYGCRCCYVAVVNQL